MERSDVREAGEVLLVVGGEALGLAIAGWLAGLLAVSLAVDAVVGGRGIPLLARAINAGADVAGALSRLTSRRSR